MRQIAQIMGMPVTIDIPKAWEMEVFEMAFERLHDIDRLYSTYKPGSEVSRFNKGQVTEKTASPEFKKILKACRQWQKETNGYFSPHHSDQLDTNGYVKGWAITEAAKIIKKAGYGTFCISAGGDILAASDSDKLWNIGIQNPRNKKSIFKTLQVKNGAVATSGTYERGAHIINPKTGKPADYWASLTVVGPDIIAADVLATAGFAAGKKARELIKKWPNYRLLGVIAGEEVGHDSAVGHT